MTNHPPSQRAGLAKRSKSLSRKDSAPRTASSKTSTGSRKPCKPFIAIKTGERKGQDVFCLLACPYCKESHEDIVKLSDLPEKCPIRRAVRISDKALKPKK